MGQKERLTIGLVGLGSWATRVYVPLLLERQDVVIRAVAARTESSRARAKEAFGGHIEVYSNYANLIAESDVEGVMICLPPTLTTDAVSIALEHDKHVWFEPPLEDTKDSNLMLALAQQTDRIFHPDLEIRYLPVLQSLQETFNKTKFGSIQRVRLHLQLPANPAGVKSYLFDLSPWYIDVLDIFMEGDPTAIELRDTNKNCDSPIREGLMKLEYGDCKSGEWDFDFSPNIEASLRIHIDSAKGEAKADLFDGTYKYREVGGSWLTGKADCTRPMYGFVGMRESLNAFLTKFRNNNPISDGAYHYHRLHQILSAVQRSEQKIMNTGKSINTSYL